MSVSERGTAPGLRESALEASECKQDPGEQQENGGEILLRDRAQPKTILRMQLWPAGGRKSSARQCEIHGPLGAQGSGYGNDEWDAVALT